MKAKLIYATALFLLLVPALLQWQAPLVDGKNREILPPAKPSLPDPLQQALFDLILAHNLWDKERGQIVADGVEAAGLKSKLALKCRLNGISYSQMQPPQAMFSCDGKVKLLQEGAELPDKSLLREIHADHVVLEKNGELLNGYLFGKKETDSTTKSAKEVKP